MARWHKYRRPGVCRLCSVFLVVNTPCTRTRLFLGFFCSVLICIAFCHEITCTYLISRNPILSRGQIQRADTPERGPQREKQDSHDRFGGIAGVRTSIGSNDIDQCVRVSVDWIRETPRYCLESAYLVLYSILAVAGHAVADYSQTILVSIFVGVFP